MKKKLICTALVLLLALTLAAPFSGLAATTDKLAPVANFVSGEEYVLAITGINDYRGSFGEACVVGKEESEFGLSYALRPKDLTAAKNCLWRITQKADGSVTLYSTSAKQYLNLEKDVASLSDTEQELQATISGGKISIYTDVGGQKYYLRFTNMYKTYSCWHAGTGTSSNSFTLYASQEVAAGGEYDNTGKTPIFSVACFADLHVDYGIQSWKTPIRKGTIDAVNQLKKLGGADVILVGGDILSQNDRAATWNSSLIEKARRTVYETLMEGSSEWLVLPVTGNHDSEPGVAAGSSEYSGDWEPYLQEWVGEYDAELRNESSPFNELLGYQYNIGGIEFICINTPYLAQRSSGLYESQAQWLDQQLSEIDRDETVIVMSHYPVVHNKYPMGTIGSGDARTAFENVLKKYPNVLYCYGHVHEGDSEFAWYSASELIRPTGATTHNEDNSYSTTQYINCHMGSMGYYNNKFQPGGLLADEPQIVQFMKMDFYEDHITFNYYNAGEESADAEVYEIMSYTIKRDMTAQFGIEAAPDTSSDTASDTETGTSDKTTDTADTETQGNETPSSLPTQTDSDAASDGADTADGATGLVIGIAVASVLLVGVAGFLLVFLKKK